ncbi:hypothetical protein GCM10012285_29860 [Streptomyces kronopolitis]|uniref:Uncharacterized protein n=1 Tax=Streptomyces kronopolitis TaxID=1612435 RepID=A0ABQ2JIE0_9ACTN|nr:hypothetical protein GCM10012285_29860 [Streptomyces kronopolitis]
MRTGAALRLRLVAFGRRAALGGLRIAGLLGLVRGHLGGRGLLILRTASEHNTQEYVLAAAGPRSDGHDPATERPGPYRLTGGAGGANPVRAGITQLFRTLHYSLGGRNGARDRPGGGAHPGANSAVMEPGPVLWGL